MANPSKNEKTSPDIPDDTHNSPVIAQDVDVAESGLKRDLKIRHMQMIAIGGSIGAGLFVGSGRALNAAGPGSLLIDFMITGFMLLLTINAMGELSCMYPVAGAFYAYSTRFIDPGWGFAMGWNYSMSWLIALPFELITAGITINFWTDPELTGTPSINVGIWVTLFLVSVCIISFFGVNAYGEVELILGVMKITAIIGFIILGVIIDVGGIPTDTRGYIGAKYWHDPGAFRNGFRGFCSVFVSAAFAFGGTELVGLAVAEADNPHKSIPKATKQVFWRITIFYLVSLFLLGLIVPSDHPHLSQASTGATRYSPFVLAMKIANIKILPSVFNAVITLSVISVANSCTFASTRTIQAMCQRGMGPSIGAKVDKKGRPWVVVIVVLLFGCLAYIGMADNGSLAFTWLLAVSGLSSFFTWGSICLAHIRFRSAWALNGRSVDDLPFAAMFGVTGSYIGLALNILCLIGQFYVALFPIGRKPDVVNFLQSYLAFPVVILFFVSYKIYHRQWSFGVNFRTIDVDAGRRAVDLVNLKDDLARERAIKATWPWWKRQWDIWF